MHVIFGTGPMGLTVAAACVHRGYDVRLVNRSGEIPAEECTRLPGTVEVARADLTDPPAARRMAWGADAVFHCASAPQHRWADTLPALMEGAIDAAQYADAPLIYGDNLYAYAQSDAPLTEQTPEIPPSKKGAIRKQVAEQLRLAHQEGRVRAAIGRASDFYGPGVTYSAVGEEIFGRLAKAHSPRLLGKPHQLHSFSYIEDVGRALVVLSEHERAWGHTWHLPNARAVPARWFAAAAAHAMGQKETVVVPPSWMLKVVGVFDPVVREFSEMLYQWERPFVVCDARFMAEFGQEFGATMPLDIGVVKTARWFQNRV